MKQYIKKYQDFLNEALTKKESDKYSKIQVVQDVKAIHDKIFGDTERIYIPFDFAQLKSVDKSKTQIRVEYILSKNGYEIVSYSENKCKKVNDSNVTKIAKVLNSKLNKPDLAVDYGQDVEKSRNLESVEDMYVCISRNSDDIASMSTDRAWDSCQNIRTGSERKYVAHDIKQGSIIAYLIKSTDREILDPESRILIKPFVNIKNKKDIVLLPATDSYYRGKGVDFFAVEKYPNFYKFLMSWVKSVQENIDGNYKMQKNVYADGSLFANMKQYTPEEIERIEDPQTKEDIKLAFGYYDINLPHCKFDTDGFVNHSWDVKIVGDFRTLPKVFKFIKTIYGNLDLSECPRLKSFNNLENLKSVRNIYTYSYNGDTVIENVKGLENLEKGFILDDIVRHKFIDFKYPGLKEKIEDPKSIEDFEISKKTGVNKYTKTMDISMLKMDSNGLFEYDGTLEINGDHLIDYIPQWLSRFKKIREFICIKTGVEDFTTLKNLVEVEILDIKWNMKVKSLNGLQKIKKLDSFFCYELPIKDFSGLDNVEVIGYLDCSATLIKDFTSLKKIRFMGALRCDGCRNLIDFKGLERLNIIGTFNCSYSQNIESFNGLENMRSISEFYCHGKDIPKNLNFKGLEKINIQKFTPEDKYQQYLKWKSSIKK